MVCPDCGTETVATLHFHGGVHRYCPQCDDWKPRVPGFRGWPKPGQPYREYDPEMFAEAAAERASLKLH